MHLGTIGAFFLLGIARVWACPWCKDALFSPGEAASQSGAAKGYAWSIGLLLGLPVLMLSVIALVVIRSARRTKRLSVKDER